MGFLADSVLDAGLTLMKTNVNRCLLLSSAPTSYADAVTKTLGTKTSPSLGALADGVSNGRRFTVAAFTDGAVGTSGGSTSGEVWALVDSVNSVLYAYADVTGDQVVVSGNTFSMTAFDVTMPDAA